MNDDECRLISSLEAQEERLVFTRFDNADAWRLGSAMVAAATERSLPVTIDIRRHGQQLFPSARPGTTAENDAWIERKVNVVDRSLLLRTSSGGGWRRPAPRLTRRWASSRGCSRRTGAPSRSASARSASWAASPSPDCPRPRTTPSSSR
jgi:hypothetical protein